MKNKITRSQVICYLSSLFILCASCTSCNKEDTIETISPKTEEPTPDSIVKPDKPQIYSKTISVGKGSGDLVIDGKSIELVGNTLFKIKGGNYNTITIKNVTVGELEPIVIENDQQVTISYGMYTDNISNVILSGAGAKDIKYGFSFKNIAYRAISMSGKMNGVTIKNMSFENVKDLSISGSKNNGSDLRYDGSTATRTERFKILDCFFDNSGSIGFGGNLDKTTGEDSGFFKDVEIAYNTYQNSPNWGNVFVMTNVQDFNIHHNIINNINQQNNNHNGVFFMQGNGKFHDNKLTNYQGNALRLWLYSRGNSPVTVEIYNNICYNTRKYGGFELQSFDRHLIAGKSTFANAKVNNNTVGKMNTNHDWQGQILDLYNLNGGTLEFYDNLGFNLYSDDEIGHPSAQMINNMSNSKIINRNGNRYSLNSDDLVGDLFNFVSKITHSGASL